MFFFIISVLASRVNKYSLFQITFCVSAAYFSAVCQAHKQHLELFVFSFIVHQLKDLCGQFVPNPPRQRTNTEYCKSNVQEEERGVTHDLRYTGRVISGSLRQFFFFLFMIHCVHGDKLSVQKEESHSNNILQPSMSLLNKPWIS